MILMKKAISVLISACVLFSLIMGVSAISSTQEHGSISQFEYIVVDKNGDVIDSGSVNYASRQSYDPVYIANGSVMYFKTGSYGLLVPANKRMSFTFRLDRPSECSFSWYEGDAEGNSQMVADTSYTDNKIVGATDFYTSSAGYKYYYTGIRNVSSNTFQVTQASIDW